MHGKGVLNLAIKPSNIQLAKEGRNNLIVKMIDFTSAIYETE